MTQTVAKLNRQQLASPQLPLAIYREIVAHLRQLEGVNAGLISQQAQNFDYLQSQVGGLWIEYAKDITPTDKQKVEDILAYYARKYAPWSTIGLRPSRINQ